MTAASTASTCATLMARSCLQQNARLVAGCQRIADSSARQRVSPNPVVTLNRTVALAEVEGPAVALEVLTSLAEDRRVRDHHRFHAARAHLLEQLGDVSGAADAFRAAARLSTSRPERRHLERRAHDLSVTP